MASPHLGGGKICCKGAIFSPDGKYLVAAGFGAVRVYSAATGQRVGALAENVVSIATHPEEKSTVYAALPNGMLIAWDILSQRVLKEINTQAPITDMIVQVDLKQWTLGKNWSHQQMNAAEAFLSSDSSGSLIAVTSLGEHMVKIFHSHLQKKHLCLKISKIQKTPITCIKLSECGNILAVGLESGAIAIYHNIKKMVEKETQYDTRKPSIVHWHREGVCSLEFCPDGIYLASAGVEGVLVLWHLETLKPVFVPRIGGEIARITVSPVEASIYGVCLKRNAIKLIDTASHQIKGGVWGMISPPVDVSPADATGVCQLHPNAGWITLTGDNGVLQFYDIMKDRHIKLLQTLERNSLQYFDNKSTASLRPIEPRVQNMAFCADGSTLVTVGVCPSLSSTDGIQTKLTFWDQTLGSREPYEINTTMDEPHKSHVAALCCSPCNDIVITTSSSGEFKLWAKQATNNSVSWRCRSMSSYRGEPMSGCSFSSDGTVLAVACTSCVTLWDPMTLTRLGLLPFPVDLQASQTVDQLEFVPGTDFLVGCSPSAPFLVVWDLLRLVIHWAIPLHVDQLTADPILHKFALVIKGKQGAEGEKIHDDIVAVFSPEDSTPVNVYGQAGRKVSCLRFAPIATPMQAIAHASEGHVAPHSPLVIIFDTRQFYLETGNGQGELMAEDAESPRSAAKILPSPLQLAFGQSPDVTSIQKISDQNTLPTKDSDEYFKDLRDVPSHRLPPVNLMCSDFFGALMSKKRKLEESSQVGAKS